MQKRHVFGGYDWVNDTITWTVADTKNRRCVIYASPTSPASRGHDRHYYTFVAYLFVAFS